MLTCIIHKPRRQVTPAVRGQRSIFFLWFMFCLSCGSQGDEKVNRACVVEDSSLIRGG